MPRVIFILSSIVAFGAVLAYAMWPSTRPHATATRECPDNTRELALEVQVEELEAARSRLEAEAKTLRALATCADDDAPPEKRACATTETQVQSLRTAPPLSTVLTPEQRILSLRQRNGQLFRELGLTVEESQKLLAALAQQDERYAQPSVQRHDVQRDHEELVRALGQDKATRFEALRKTMGARAELRRVRDQLEQAGEPLSEEQRQKLAARITARPSVSLELRELSGADVASARARLEENARQRSEQLRSDMATVLTPAQMELFDQSQELRKAYSSQRTSMIGAGAAGSGAPTR